MTLAHTPAQQHSIAKALVLAAVRRAIKPKERITVSDWADANRWLVEGADSEPGQFRTMRNPPIREIQDQLSEHSPAKKIVFMGPTQFAKTMIATNWIGHVTAHAKGSMAVYMPTENTLTDWNEQKFEPMAEHTPAVRDAMAGRNSGANSMRRKRYTGGTLYFRSAGSTADLKNLSLRYAIADEVDEYERDTGQGDVIGLIEARTSTYPDGKLYVCSTPTMKGASLIEEQFEGGDQRHYHVPCPHCGEWQKLKWTNLQWHRIPSQHITFKDVWYACEHNGCVIHEHEKTGMIEQGRWIAENPGAPYPSYTINALYTPTGLGLSWAALAQEWLEAQGDPVKLMRFINTRLAEPFADRTSDIKAKTLSARAEPYSLRTVPQGCYLITCGVDVQSGATARLEIQVTGHGRNNTTWPLDYHVIPGNPAGDEVWDALADYVNNIAFTNRFGKTLRSEACAIDIGGHHAHDVYNFVRNNRVKRPMAIQGASRPGRVILGKPTPQDVNWRGKTIKHGVMLYQIGTDTAKHLLYGRLHDDTDKPAEERKVRFSAELPEEYYEGLVAETFNPKKNKFECKKGKRNEPLDTWVYALAAAHHPEIYMHKWRKADWDRRAAQVEPVEREDAAQEAAEEIHPTVPPPAPPTSKKSRRRAGGGNFATRW